MHELSKNVKATVVQAAVAAGSTDVATAEVDMSGYEGVLFLASLTPASTATTYKVSAQVAASTTTTFATVYGSSEETGASGGMSGTLLHSVDLRQPSQRYARCYVTRDTSNVAIESVIALQYGPMKAPTTWSTSNSYVAVPLPGATSS